MKDNTNFKTDQVSHQDLKGEDTKKMKQNIISNLLTEEA
jgi:hypothetical protein